MQRKLTKIHVREGDAPHEVLNRIQEHHLAVLNPFLKLVQEHAAAIADLQKQLAAASGSK